MKKVTLLVLALALLLSAAGCGKPKTIDMDALATELANAGIYDDILSQMPQDMAERFYDMDDGDVVRAILYYGTGATAEEICILQCKDEKTAEKAEENARTHIQNQKTSFENYVPSEIPKLDDAVVESSGVYVIVVVSKDASTAQSIINKYIK